MSAETPVANVPAAAPAEAVVKAEMASTTKQFNKVQKQKLYKELGLWEKGFTIGVMNLFVNLLVLARWPQYFWILHLALGAIFLPWRFLRFRQRNWEWYLVDFCYCVTYYTVIGCIFALARSTLGFPSPIYRFNFEAIRAGFAFANGALVLSVPLFGNKIVFHDVDNTTSVYIHLSPALMFWTLRWGGGFGTSLIEQTWPGMFDVCRDMQEGDAAVNSILGALWHHGDCGGTLFQFIAVPALCWVVLWGFPYYLLNFCCLRGYLKRKNKENLFTNTVQDAKGVGRFVTKLPAHFQPLGFMVQHFLFAVTAGFASMLLWGSFVLHTALLFGIFLFAVHNGSTFMFRVVAARHVQGVVSSVAVQPLDQSQSPSPDTNKDSSQQARV